MVKKTILFVLVVGLFCVPVQSGQSGPKLPDGFVLAGVDGKLVSDGNEGPWRFELGAEVNTGASKIKAGTRLELLPCSALEKTIAGVNKHKSGYYRLWGRTTRYKGKSYIFAIYFLPLSRIEPAKQDDSKGTAVAINEPNDELALPEEIVSKLKKRKIIRPEQLEKSIELKTDYILADRVGVIEFSDGEASFVFDCIGRNVGQVRLGLLRCQALERVQAEQLREAEMIRFKVSGIITQYKKENYLLLQRATRVYGNDNFR